MIPRLSSTILVALSISVVALTASSEDSSKSSWTSGTFSHRIDGSFDRFQIVSVKGEGDKVRGEFLYDNSTEKGVPPAVTLPGVKMSDGSFWPNATLYVGKTRDGEWKPVQSTAISGEAVSVVIPPTLCLMRLQVDFAPFRPFLRSMALGKAVLPNGETAYFDLSELLPPDERESRRTATPGT